MALKSPKKAAAPAAKKLAAPKAAAKGSAKKPAGKLSAKAKEPPVKVGDHIQFVGYSTEQEEPLFQPEQKLLVVGVMKDAENKKVVQAIALEDEAAYAEDPDSVDGEELVSSEYTKIKKEIVKKDEFEIEVTSIGDLDEYLEGDLADNANQLREDAAKSMFYLGGIIAKLFQNRRFATDYKGFEDATKEDGTPIKRSGWAKFCTEKLGMSDRSAYDYMSIYLKFSAIPNVDIARLNKIGWSKANIIAPYANDANVAELMKVAERQNVPSLRQTMKTDYIEERTSERGRVSTSVKRITFGPFKLFEDQAEGAAIILEKAQKLFGFDDPGLVFEAILTQWAMQNLPESAVTSVKQAAKRKIKALKSEGIDTSASEKAAEAVAKVLQPAGA